MLDDLKREKRAEAEATAARLAQEAEADTRLLAALDQYLPAIRDFAAESGWRLREPTFGMHYHAGGRACSLRLEPPEWDERVGPCVMFSVWFQVRGLFRPKPVLFSETYVRPNARGAGDGRDRPFSGAVSVRRLVESLRTAYRAYGALP